MQKGYEHIDKMLPYGELIRGFANQSEISDGDLKNALRERGIFFSETEREKMTPCLTTLLLSPKEFDNLREQQNTREDNPKKSSSRLNWTTNKNLIEAIPAFIDVSQILPTEYINYKIVGQPAFVPVDNNPNKILLEYIVERNDLNKSWYEAKNTFKGNLLLEKTSDNEVSIIKTYTSQETDFVGSKFETHLLRHFKLHDLVSQDTELHKIKFLDFSNEERIVFFWRLTSHMDSTFFKFIDIVDIEMKPDETMILPEKIEWMNNKDELAIRGKDIHNSTFFIKEKEYHKYLKFWSIEAKFKFEFLNVKGKCNVYFGFPKFTSKGDNAEFEINITGSLYALNQEIDIKTKNKYKQKILDSLEIKKNEIYKNYINYLNEKKKESN